mmetsp:Transcript_55802/g.154482  ORF Transcript_55802/g.154482 Transcript_55802/m.154482 type:complete len:447 (-) Transcript_55802:107-1447(-)
MDSCGRSEPARIRAGARSTWLAVVVSLLWIVGLVAVCERSLRRRSLPTKMDGRESWAPNYRHIWFAHDPSFVYGGRFNDSLCSFGSGLARHHDNWKNVCGNDYDKDGLTNGQELGDPCCLWTPEAVGKPFSLHRRHEYRRWGITHPSKPDNLTLLSHQVEPLNCSEYVAETYAKQFEAFYFLKADGPYEPVPPVPAKLISLAVFVIALGDWFWRRGLALDICPWLAWKRAPLSPWVSLIAPLVAFIYMDLTSGIVHLILDYAPAWIPGIGPLAKGFQYHHFDPTAIIRISWYSYVSHVHLLCPLVALLLVLSDASRASRVFWFWGAVFVHLFQTTHRWAHFPPSDLPRLVRLLQASGMVLTHTRHMAHHEDLERQFTILSGHTDVVLDAASRLVPPWRYDLWMVFGVFWFLLPVGLDIRFRARLESMDASICQRDKLEKPKELHLL